MVRSPNHPEHRHENDYDQDRDDEKEREREACPEIVIVAPRGENETG
jgi:hypothetical protein